MIRFLLLVLLALALGASGAYYLRADAGYVQLAWHSWSLETSLMGFTLAVAATSFAAYYGTRLLIAGLRLPAILRGAMSERRRRRAQNSFETGLTLLLEGRWRRAEVELIRRAADHPARGLNYLFAADAARKLGAHDRAQRYLQQAGENLPAPAALARAAHAMEQSDWIAARQILLKLYEQDPRHQTIVEQLGEVHAQVADWDSYAQLLSAAQSAKLLAGERVRAWQQRFAHGRLETALSQGRLDQFKSAWEATASSQRAEPEFRRAYVAGLARLNAGAEATAQITAALRDSWDSELVKLYGELGGTDAMTQLATAEQWLVKFGEKPELLWIAARACARNRLWAKARSYFEGLIRIAPSASAYMELAQLCQQMQMPEDAARYYRQGLEFAAKV